MLLHKVVSNYGRLAPKPEKPERMEEILEEHLTIQDQIENLRTKIGLKERYTKVLAEEFEESRQGASSILRELYFETRELRLNLVAAINSEKQAVQNALRTQHAFQLALTDRASTEALPWLEDRLCDIIKTFNYHLHALQRKRAKLEDAERHVIIIEKWPRPGTLPWEILALDKFHNIENQAENVRIKRETAFNLNSKYHDLKMVLREEKGRYMPTLRLLENQYRIQKNELQNLNKMLGEANGFRDETWKNLVATEREASENRKVRRQQMTKMKRRNEIILAENLAAKPPPRIDYPDQEEAKSDLEKMALKLKQKRIVLIEYEERAKRIVETMRVHDLTEIPSRYQLVTSLSRQLRIEKVVKENVRNALVKKRDQLQLVKSQFEYTGANLEHEYSKLQQRLVKSQSSVEEKLIKATSKLQDYGDIVINLRLAVISALGRLEEGEPKRYRKADLRYHLRTLQQKTKRLLKEVAELESLLNGKERDRHHPGFLKPPPVPPRLVRVGYGPKVSSESEGDDDEVPDSHVPSRIDIKSRSQRVKQQAILKRGLK